MDELNIYASLYGWFTNKSVPLELAIITHHDTDELMCLAISSASSSYNELLTAMKEDAVVHLPIEAARTHDWSEQSPPSKITSLPPSIPRERIHIDYMKASKFEKRVKNGLMPPGCPASQTKAHFTRLLTGSLEGNFW
ncbi:unnamed protein product [Lepeophtheirus salmonis]|uniref:(salmon louse) hypothetical protein n=1 Tax=Lepeophtheirus salmonis TaxID=72036 RepID=A0A817FGE4_LEPSM|nr:unnamed protein product [Lepeophtheirus salmonis]CAG9478822.1 unnamed protein product [Lepeophtheirus salmonis]